MDPDKLKKLENYCIYLAEKGAAEEKSKEYAEAIGTYLKLVDVLLVTADATPNYPNWVKCTTRAEGYQKRIKQLIALASLERDKVEIKPTTVSNPNGVKPR